MQEIFCSDLAIQIINCALHCETKDIKNIKALKKGMTNNSFTFTVNGEKYLIRLPGEGTDKLINRKQEEEVYKVIQGKNICDDLLYLNANNGIKIAKYVEVNKTCDSSNFDDISLCFKKLREFHNLKLTVNHYFDLFKMIDFYEGLWSTLSIYPDYKDTKRKIFELQSFIENLKIVPYLTHIDAVADNFIFCSNGAKTDIQLIDFEYAAMQDQHLDIAMFCIYATYDSQEMIDKVIDCYFEGSCEPLVRAKIYCYIAIAGLLWSNWCEYKRQLGIDFGDYALKQYNYAKDYYLIALDLIKRIKA